MADGNVSAIEIQGIVRNRTKIGVEDGQAEDLLNLRFVNGSWRASGDGRMIDFTMGREYSQLYIHTNIYRHLLGVYDGTLYWFANIAEDGVTFTPLDTPVALTTVTGDIWITQTGHLLTVIDESDDFEHFLFMTDVNNYTEQEQDLNGNRESRKLFPYNQVHFNCHCPIDDEHIAIKHIEEVVEEGTFYTSYPNPYYSTIVHEVREKNQFGQPFLACAALKLYDGKYVMASNPVLVYPRERVKSGERGINLSPRWLPSSTTDSLTMKRQVYFKNESFYKVYYLVDGDNNPTTIEDVEYDNTRIDFFANESGENPIPEVEMVGAYSLVGDVCGFINGYRTIQGFSNGAAYFAIGSDLVVSIEDELTEYIRNNETISSLCIFVTPECNMYKVDDEGKLTFDVSWLQTTYFKRLSTDAEYTPETVSHYFSTPKTKDREAILHELMHYPFYLLREYNKNSISELQDNPIVDLTLPEYEGLLENIVQQKTLDAEALSRSTYLPKVSYMYNGRLHIANYKTFPFFGYPIDIFHLHNHSVKFQEGAWFPADEDGKRVLPNITGDSDEYQQYAKQYYEFPSSYPGGLEYFAYITINIDSSAGEQRVVRYIAPYDVSISEDGRADFIESLNPLLCYPDARAKSMTITIYRRTIEGLGIHYVASKDFQLKPHQYLNMAYYIDPDLKPIDLIENSRGRLPVPTMQNIEEYFPNGLKVSSTDNPMFFPVENTYQVGSAEIKALMANAIAVGTGQTGAAPLYVFCSDGVYALFVDASGQMTYTNARVLARDVCNNPRSVTPIDAGVVFSTDRGLMMIAGEQMQEIGEPAEGNVLLFADDESADYIKIAGGAFTKVAGLPDSLCDTTDFLTYLKGAIINYNHNERELMVSNPEKSYSYILDRDYNWSRRDYTADEYVNNYPTSYRFVNGEFYKVDEDGTNDTPLEERKESDNRFFYLSNVIKLGSIGFKQGARFVVRGYFEAWLADKEFVRTYISEKEVYVAGQAIESLAIGESLRMAYMHIYGVDEWVEVDSSGQTGNILNVSIYDAQTMNDVTHTIRETGYPSDYVTIIKEQPDKRPTVGCYIFGSYDGRKWALLGGNEKQGKFTNIGCKIERTDVRFLRICLAGQITGKTRIDYMEISSKQSVLNTKIR